jgi:signal transduction histidine kinase
MNVYQLIQILALLVNYFVWIVVYAQRRRTPVSRAFLFFTAWASGWIGVELLYHTPLVVGRETLFYRLSACFWTTVCFAFLHFAYRLLGRRRDALYVGALGIALAGLALTCATDLVAYDFVHHDWGMADVRGPLHTAVSFASGAGGLAGLLLVARAMRGTRTKNKRRTYQLILFGGGVALTTSLTMNTVLPNFLGLTTIPRLGSASLAVFCYFIYLAMVRFRFLRMSLEQVVEELFDDVSSGAILVDRSLRIRRINRAAREMLDVSRSAVLGTVVRDLFDHYPAGSEFEAEESRIGEGDDARFFSVTQSKILRGDTLLGGIVLMREVTERKRIELIMRRSRDELEEEAERRARELRQAQKMEAIGTLAGGIAHDFNNLLAGIVGFATAARDDMPADSPLRADMEEVLQAARRARDIVQQILTFSRRDEFRPEPVDFTAVVDEALGLLGVSLPGSIRIVKEVVAEVDQVLGDPSQLNQVVMNLCTNAAQAMKENGGDLGVRLAQVELGEAEAERAGLDPGPHVRLVVSDAGCGMDPATRARIFEPFFTTKPYGEGTGLGLATVKTIVENHAGAIDIESEAGVGTTVSVHLPVIDARITGEDADVRGLRGGDERILLVDDQAQLVRMGRRLLEPLGYRITAFTSSLEAWDAFRERPGEFDLVITDQTMPAMTGMELAGKILGLRDDVPVVLISGYTSNAIAREARRIGVRSFLAKPVTKHDLGATVREILDSA